MKKFVLSLLGLIISFHSIAQSSSDSIVSVLHSTAAFTDLTMAKEDPSNVKKLVLKRKKIVEIPQEIFQFTELEYLDLSSNKITVIPKEISKLTKLKVLIVENNKIKELPEELFMLTGLLVISAGNNEIYYMSSKIKNLTKLIQLDLWSNNISEFPAEIGELTELKVLDLRSIAMNADQQMDIRNLLPNTKVLFDESCNCN